MTAIAFQLTPRGAHERQRRNRPRRIALAGCGVVGTAFVQELTRRGPEILRRHDQAFEIVSILVRDMNAERDACVDRSLLTDDVDAFLRVDADCVVEAIGGVHPARRIAERSLRAGRRVVTANKALIAAHGESLRALSTERRADIRFDAAVGGGVPMLRLLDDAIGACAPAGVRAILNGTTNYVLSRLEDGGGFDDAIIAARAAGFAEADHTRDLDGRDAADKLALIAWSAFQLSPRSASVECVSLLSTAARAVDLATRAGGIIRQVAECIEVEGGIVSVVEPILLSPDSEFARTRDERNHVEVATGWSSPLTAGGPGAGGVPTAVALLSDVLATPSNAEHRSSHRPAADDPRHHRWIIEIHGAPAALYNAIPGCTSTITDARAERVWAIVDGLTRRAIRTVVGTLADIGVDPIAIRVDASFTRTPLAP